jgi:ferredoxin
MKAAIYQNKCGGSGPCVDICPEVFERVGDKRTAVKNAQVPAEAQARCQKAAANCPANAIFVKK